MKHSTDTVEEDPYTRTPAFRDLGAQRREQRLDFCPSHIGRRRLLEDPFDKVEVLPRRHHGVTIRHYIENRNRPRAS